MMATAMKSSGVNNLILIVEDSATQAEKLRYLLEQHGYLVNVAKEGKQALVLIKETRPALIISDIVMPEMNGYELCRQIKADENTWQIPVVLLTSLSDIQDVVEGLACGADSFMTKPYSEDYLLKHVEQTFTNSARVFTKRAGVEVEILLQNARYMVTAEPQQMLSLLLSTYEAAVHRNTELVRTQEELSSLNEHLEELVEERTAELSDENTARKQAEEEIRHRLSELEAIYDSSQAVGKLLLPEKIGQKLIDILSERLQWHHASLLQYNLETETIELLAFREPGVENEAERLEAEERFNKVVKQSRRGFAGWVIEHGLPVNCGDVTQDESYIEIWPSIRSIILVPLKIGERTIGCLSVGSERNNAFTETDEWLITTLATQAASALENARLFEETHQRLAESEAVKDISISLRTAKSLEDMLPAFLDEMMGLLGTAAIAIWLYDADSDLLHRAVCRGWITQFSNASVKPGEGLVGSVFAEAKSQLSREFNNDAVLDANLMQVPSGWGGVCMPIRSALDVLGVMLVSVQLPRELTTGELRVLNTLAEIVGIAIHRMRLHEQTEQQLQHVQALHEIDTVIASSFDLSFTLDVFLKNVLTQLHVDAASILLLNPVSHALDYIAQRGFRVPSTEQWHLGLREGFAGIVANERLIVHSQELSDETNTPAYAQLIENEGFVSYFGIPLIVKGEVNGVLEIFHRTMLKPNTEWMDFLEALSSQASIAIDSILTYNDLQNSNLKLEMTYDLTLRGWSRALDMRDKETEGHSERVTDMTMQLARALVVDEEEMEHIRHGALLHDVGKIGIPNSILLKPGPLTAEEWEVMRTHPFRAYELLSPIPYLRSALEIPYCHHEKWDGSGYPRGLKGEEIPLAARIFAINDVFDALSSDRPYRKAWPEAEIYAHLKAESGKHFDPKVVKAFLKMKGEG